MQIQAIPLLYIGLISLIATAVIMFIYKRFSNQARLKEIKDKQKELQKQIKGLPAEKVIETQKEMMTINFEYMKLTMKPMLITFIPVLIVLGILRKYFASAGDIIFWGKDVWMFHTGAGWLLTYFIFSVIFTMIIRKIFKIN